MFHFLPFQVFVEYIWKFDSWAIYNYLIDWPSEFFHRYFLLVVAVCAHSKNKEYLVCANVSERIIVRVRSLFLFIIPWDRLIRAANNNSIIKQYPSKICPCLTKNHTLPPGALTVVLYEEAPPLDPTPCPFTYRFGLKRYPFLIPVIRKWYSNPFTYLL